MKLTRYGLWCNCTKKWQNSQNCPTSMLEMKITFKQYVLNYQVDFDETLLELFVLAGNLNKIAPNPNSRINFQIAILIYPKLIMVSPRKGREASIVRC